MKNGEQSLSCLFPSSFLSLRWRLHGGNRGNADNVRRILLIGPFARFSSSLFSERLIAFTHAFHIFSNSFQAARNTKRDVSLHATAQRHATHTILPRCGDRAFCLHNCLWPACLYAKPYTASVTARDGGARYIRRTKIILGHASLILRSGKLIFLI